MERFEVKRLVEEAVVENKFVVVADVMVASVPKKLVMLPVVPVRVEAKNVVVVALVPVAFPVMRRLPESVVEAKRPSVIEGAVPKTSAPVPVSSVTSEPSSAEVSIEVELTLLLKMVQSPEER